jgi:hypothetical protein
VIWGAVIPVTITDDEKPDWLDDDQICAVGHVGILWFGEGGRNAARGWDWNRKIAFIKLPANHSYYEFEARTEREWKKLEDVAFEGIVGFRASLSTYRHYIQQHIKDAKP